MIGRALPTCATWAIFVVALDLPYAAAVAGVLCAFLLAWRDEWRERRARGTGMDDEDDELLERTSPIFYV